MEQYLHGLEIKPDELTAVEREKLLREGKEVDRIPCCIDTGETLAPMIGIKVKDYYFSSLDCQSKSNRQIEKSLIRGTKAETLSWTVVQPFYNS